MKIIIIGVITLFLILYILFGALNMRIEVVEVNSRKYRILLWYDSNKDGLITRKWIKLFDFKSKKT